MEPLAQLVRRQRSQLTTLLDQHASQLEVRAVVSSNLGSMGLGGLFVSSEGCAVEAIASLAISSDTVSTFLIQPNLSGFVLALAPLHN